MFDSFTRFLGIRILRSSSRTFFYADVYFFVRVELQIVRLVCKKLQQFVNFVNSARDLGQECFPISVPF